MELKDKLREEFASLHLEGAGEIPALTRLPGSYINLACRLPGGTLGKILDDGKSYWAAQAHKEGSERCYGLAGDEGQLAVFEYGCNGSDAELVLWKRR